MRVSTVLLFCFKILYIFFRFQEIAGCVEKALTDPKVNGLSSDWKLTATKIVWENLLRCWANKVFITQLTHRFSINGYVLLANFLRSNLLLQRFYWQNRVIRFKLAAI